MLQSKSIGHEPHKICIICKQSVYKRAAESKRKKKRINRLVDRTKTFRLRLAPAFILHSAQSAHLRVAMVPQCLLCVMKAVGCLRTLALEGREESSRRANSESPPLSCVERRLPLTPLDRRAYRDCKKKFFFLFSIAICLSQRTAPICKVAICKYLTLN